jgi:hypothetical protein
MQQQTMKLLRDGAPVQCTAQQGETVRHAMPINTDSTSQLNSRMDPCRTREKTTYRNCTARKPV